MTGFMRYIRTVLVRCYVYTGLHTFYSFLGSCLIAFHRQISLPIFEIENISSRNNGINNFFNEEEY